MDAKIPTTSKPDIIRKIKKFVFNFANRFKFDPEYIDGELGKLKQEAIDMAKRLKWKKWEFTEIYIPYYMNSFCETPIPSRAPKNWKEAVKMSPYNGFEYQVILYKK